MPLNTTTFSVTPLLGAILIFVALAASPGTAEAQADMCSNKQGVDYDNCMYCNDQTLDSNGQLFSAASSNRVSQATTLECKPDYGSEASANAPAPSDGMWSPSIANRRDACLGRAPGTSDNVAPGQSASQVEKNLEDQLSSSWYTRNGDGELCKADAYQACQDYATTAYVETNTYAAQYGGDACFNIVNDQPPNGPRWSRKWKDHFDWCVDQTRSGNLSAVTQEAKIRLGTIDDCQRQHGQPNIDATTGQPITFPAPPQRTQAFVPPTPVPSGAMDEQSMTLRRNPTNPFASGSGGGSGLLTTNRTNPFGSFSGSGAGSGSNTGGSYPTQPGSPGGSSSASGGPNTGGSYPTQPGSPGGSSSASGGPNTGGYYPSQPGSPGGSSSASGGPNTGGYHPRPRPPRHPKPRVTTNGPTTSGSGTGGRSPGTGGFNPPKGQPQPPKNPVVTTNGSGAGSPNTGGFNPPKAQPQSPKNPVVTTNRPNPFATPSNTTNVRSFTQTHARRSNGGVSGKHYRRYSPHGRHHGGSHHASSHHGGGRHGGSHRSDIRLKHDIMLLGRLDNGLGFYRFSYNGSNKIYVGVMAQEVQAVVPEAVERGRDGYLLVIYPKLGLQFQTYEEWIASGAHVPSGSTLQH